jgi:PAS domain S-box-containing protein
MSTRADSPDAARRPPPTLIALEVLAVALTYYLAAQIGKLTATYSGNVCALWPAAGVALAAALLRGPRVWPGIALGACVANAQASWGTLPAASSIACGLANGAGASLSALLPTYVLRPAFAPHEVLRRVCAAGQLILLGAAVGPLLSALLGVMALAAAGALPWEAFPGAVATWWVGDAVGVLVVAPLLLATVSLLQGREAMVRPWEGLAAIGVLTLAAAHLMRYPARTEVSGLPSEVTFLLLPLLLWIALRCTQFCVALGSAIICTFVVGAFLNQHGPFFQPDDLVALVNMQVFVAVAATTGLAVTAVLGERRALEENLEWLVAERAAELGRANAALAESEAHYRTLFNTMHSGLALHEMIYDEGGKPVDYRFLDVNPAFEQLTGLRRESVLGRTVREVLPQIEEYWIESYGRVADTGEPADFEQYAAALDRHYHVSAFRPAPGQFACVFTDTTEAHRAGEAALQASRLEVAATFAGGVAHRINNQMTSVLGHTELLRQEPSVTPSMDAQLRDISAGARRVSELAHQLVAFTRGGRYAPRRLDLNHVVREALAELTADGDAPIQVDAAADLWPIVADPTQMAELVTDLCTNALEALAEGDTVDVSTTNVTLDRAFAEQHGELEPGRYVKLRVEDTGSGMDPATLARAFEPFFSTRFLGRGLGLAAVYGIAAGHGGHVTAQSAPGVGSVFEVYLPAADA